MRMTATALLSVLLLPAVAGSQEVEIIHNAIDYDDGVRGLSASESAFVLVTNYVPTNGTHPCDESRFQLLDTSLSDLSGLQEAMLPVCNGSA